PLGRGSDVEEVVGAHPPAAGQRLDDLRRGHVIEVQTGVAPMLVHRMAHFAGNVFGPTPAIDRRGQALFEGRAVYFGMSDDAAGPQPRVVDNERLRLAPADDSVESILFPVALP